MSAQQNASATRYPLHYVGIRVDNFIALGQDPIARPMYKILLYLIDHVFCPLSTEDLPLRRKPVFTKKT